MNEGTTDRVALFVQAFVNAHGMSYLDGEIYPGNSLNVCICFNDSIHN